MFRSPPSILAVVGFMFASLVAVPVSAADQAPTQYTDATAFKRAILNSTNTYRSQHNATSVVWNTTLAAFADKWSAACVFKHSGGPNGENLASGYANASASIEAWGHERVDYDFHKAEFTHSTGHFTQLVWKATTSVGCSRTLCNGRQGGGAPGWYVVCEYWPRGNVIGAFGKNVQERVRENGASEKPGQEGPGGKEECMLGALCNGGGGGARSRMSILDLWIWGGAWVVVWGFG